LRGLRERPGDVGSGFGNERCSGECANPRQRARIPQPDPLQNPIPAPLRQPRPTNRCTLKAEEPAFFHDPKSGPALPLPRELLPLPRELLPLPWELAVPTLVYGSTYAR
jgi:hypothetical protein